MMLITLNMKHAIKTEYKKSFCQYTYGWRYVISIPKSDDHQPNFPSTVNLVPKVTNNLATSSKKKPKTKAKRHPSTKSKFPRGFGVFTVIVYNTKNNVVKNIFNKF